MNPITTTEHLVSWTALNGDRITTHHELREYAETEAGKRLGEGYRVELATVTTVRETYANVDEYTTDADLANVSLRRFYFEDYLLRMANDPDWWNFTAINAIPAGAAIVRDKDPRAVRQQQLCRELIVAAGMAPRNQERAVELMHQLIGMAATQADA